MKFGIAEIFAKVEAAKTNDEKIATLRKYGSEVNNTGLATLLRWCMDAKTPWHPDLPKDKIKFKPCEYFDQQTVLYQNVRKIPGLYFEGGAAMPAEKRILLWTLFLESLDPDDARLMECIRLRTTLPYKSITRKLVKEAFPGFLGEEVK